MSEDEIAIVETVLPPLSDDASRMLCAVEREPLNDAARMACADALEECGQPFLAAMQRFELAKNQAHRSILESLDVPAFLLQGDTK